VPEIQRQTAATDNVVSLVQAMMNGFPSVVRRALPIMACLGSSFTIFLFEQVARRFQFDEDLEVDETDGASHFVESNSSPDARQTTERQTVASKIVYFCEDRGVLEPVGSSFRFQWIHDKIQEAAFALLNEEDLNNLRRQMGQILYENCNEAELEERLFLVANLLKADCTNDSTSLPKQRPVDVANLYLRAGIKAMENGAFDLAPEYLKAGIQLLPPNHWEVHYEVSLNMYSAAAEAHFCLSRFEEVFAFCKEVIRQEKRPILDKRRAYTVLIDATGATGKPVEAQKLCRQILSKLGHVFPQFAVKLHILSGILKVQRSMTMATNPDFLSKLPSMVDETNQWTMALLDKCFLWVSGSMLRWVKIGEALQ
jgi:predicted ATPase